VGDFREEDGYKPGKETHYFRCLTCHTRMSRSQFPTYHKISPEDNEGFAIPQDCFGPFEHDCCVRFRNKQEKAKGKKLEEGQTTIDKYFKKVTLSDTAKEKSDEKVEQIDATHNSDDEEEDATFKKESEEIEEEDEKESE